MPSSLPGFGKGVKTNVLSLFHEVRSILCPVQRVSSEFSDSFALVVQKHRKAKGLSRAMLAARAGLHQTYIGLLERGKRSPNLATAQAIAKSLGVSLSRLIAEAERVGRSKGSGDNDERTRKSQGG
jgi:ribosome-binding protein aMBF1 (putative translation factor)